MYRQYEKLKRLKEALANLKREYKLALLIDYDNKTWGKFDEYEWKRKGAIVPGITSHNEDNINSYDIQYEILETLETYYYGNLWDRIEKLK